MSKSAWDTLKSLVSNVAPVLGNAIVPGFGGIAGTLISSALGVENEPEAMMKAIEGASPETIAKLQEVEMNNKAELEQLKIQRDIAEVKADAQTIGEVNQTMRVEANSKNKHASLWRPVWGYLSAASFFLAVIGILVLIGYAIGTKQLGLIKEVPAIITALFTLFTIPGAILGVSAWHRGVKQRVEAGEVKQSLTSAIIKRIGG